MAITTDIERRPDRARSTGQGLVLAGDRTRDFLRARRHSWVVRTLRIALPIASVTIVVVYAALVFRATGFGKLVTQLPVPRITAENLTMDNPRYEGFQPDGGKYLVAAKTAVQNFKTPTQIDLNGITGDFWQPDKTKTTLVATRGTFDNKANELDLLDGIDIVSESGLKAKLSTAKVYVRENIVISRDPVTVEMPAGIIRADKMTLRQKTKEITFLDNVRTHLKPQQKADADKPEAVDKTEKTEAKPARQRQFGASDQPVDVTSDRLDVNDGTKTANFIGNVRAVQDGNVITTPDLVVTYAGEPSAAAAARPAGAPAGQAAKVQRLLAKGPVTMTQKTGEKVTSDSADFDAAGEKATLAGSVVMTALPDRRAVAERADIDQRAETVLLTGANSDVVVTQGRNELKGRRLFVDRKAGRTSLTSPADLGGQGRIAARFYQGDGTGKPKAAKPADGAEKQSPFGGNFQTDPNAPVDIEANTLDVNDGAKAAVFRGDVQAIQGGFTVRTSEMTAYYSGDACLADTGRPAAGAKQAAQLRKIEARKKVHVSSKSGETATGDWADFDTKANTVVVGGDVTLTQGSNVVKGTRLTIDMTSGRSRIDTAPGAWVATSPDASGAPVVQGRPSALFYPKNLKGGKGAPAIPGRPAAPQQPSDAKQPDKQSPDGNWDWATRSLGNEVRN